MKKIYLVFTLMFAALLAACGSLSQQDVVDKLTTNLDDAASYLASGQMTIDSDGQEFIYQVEVAFQQPDLYRVSMRNETTNNEQIILKNDEGVFVLTPALNKKFKFQSDWPLSSSQVYLYQSLLADILNDTGATFLADDSGYTFTTAANYHGNSDLASQTVRFCPEKLVPLSAQVMDTAGEVRMSMSFDEFNFNADMPEGFFDSETVMQQTVSTMGEGYVEMVDLASIELFPSLPEGTSLTDRSHIELENGNRVILTFSGEQVFTIIQENAQARGDFSIEPVSGDLVFINGSIGALSHNSVTWINNGVEFFLVSDTLETDGLLSVAKSIGTFYQK